MGASSRADQGRDSKISIDISRINVELSKFTGNAEIEFFSYRISEAFIILTEFSNHIIYVFA